MDNISKIFLALLSVTFDCLDITAKEYQETMLHTYDCKLLDSELVFNYSCSLTKSLNERKQLTYLRNQEIYFQPGVKLHNFYLHLHLFRKFGNTYRPYLLNIEQDLCALLSKDGNSKGIGVLKKLLTFETLAKYGNYYNPCPFWGRRYERNAETVNGNFALPGVYRFDITGFTNINGIRRNISFAQITGTVRGKQ